nr:A disintegrin and metalloproteinase with thrombospondin motifs 10-like [Lytechinus pictus]
MHSSNYILIIFFYLPEREEKQDWWESVSDFSLAKDVEKKLQDPEYLAHYRRKRVSSLSTERNVETLVVADKMMMGYHGETSIESYLLTLMNIVANLYHDGSIENAINVVVTRMLLLTQDQRNLSLSHLAGKSLQSFCEWQHAMNPTPNHNMNISNDMLVFPNHDNAVLITRIGSKHGYIRSHDGEEYMLEPVDHYKKYVREGHPHVIYKRSSPPQQQEPDEEKVACSVKKREEKQEWWQSVSDFSLAKDVEKKLQDPEYLAHYRRKRVSSLSTERNVETLVVADKMMMGYHGETSIESYLLTLMNIVANLYHDGSIENAINVVVTRMLLLTQDQRNLSLSHLAGKSLQSFCEWQHAMNPTPNHNMNISNDMLVFPNHDNAVLITRYVPFH